MTNRSPSPPMLLTLARDLPARHAAFAYEVKWDGFRAIVATAGGRLTITSRRGTDMTSWYPELHALGDRLPSGTVLDGEIVCLGEDGKPSFDRISARMRRPGCSFGATFIAFDVLRSAGRDVTDRTYVERRRTLLRLGVEGPSWATCDSFEDGPALYASTRDMGLEGVVAKRLDSTYRPGLRSRSWLKIKHMRTEPFLVLGWLPPEERIHGERGGLVIGRVLDGRVARAGIVETGYDRDDVERVPRLERRRLREPDKLLPDAAAANIRFLEWTSSGHIRHASFAGYL